MPGRSQRSGAVTIFDVAAAAGVSTATVSRVANGYPNIRPSTRERVEEAMERLGYVANRRARGLAGGRTNVIGLLVDELDSSYINQVAQGVDRAVSAAGYDIMLSTMHLRSRATRYVEQLFNGLADGLIVLLASGFEPYLDTVEQRSFPVVLIDHTATRSAPVVKTANGPGTREAVRHLVDLGHRRIGFITGQLDVSSGRERLEAFRDETEALGCDVDDALIEQGDFRMDDGVTAARAMLGSDHPPTAIIASSDMEAFGVMHAARELGRTIPGDLSVIGFDDLPEASYVSPALTTVRQPMQEMGTTAADLLIKMIEGDGPVAKLTELPTELVVRGSTGPAPLGATGAGLQTTTGGNDG